MNHTDKHKSNISISLYSNYSLIERNRGATSFQFRFSIVASQAIAY